MQARRGRPPKPEIRWQDQLTLRQAIRYVRELRMAGQSRGIGYARLHQAIVTGALPACEDRLRRDRYGNFLLVVTKADLDAWLNASLRPVPVVPILLSA